MEYEEILEAVKERLPAQRFTHVLGVVETARILAVRFGADADEAMLAAVLHDVAKVEPADQMKQMILREVDLPKDILRFHSELWHAPVGAFIAQHTFGITNPFVLDAVRFHTTGRMNMTLLEKIIFLADYIEPNRTTPGVADCRELAESDINAAIILVYKRTVAYLLSKNATIHPDTIYGYNDLVSQ